MDGHTMVDYKNWTVSQWLGVAGFALTSLAGAAWFVGLFDPKIAAAVSGGLAYLASVINFVIGKAPASNG